MQKYNTYKDTGVNWLGEIPEHWEFLANKHIFKLKKNLVGKKSSEYELLSLTLRGIIKRDMENPEGKFPAEFDTYQEVKKGDFIFCLFDVEETPRTVGLSEFDGMITGAYTVFNVNSKSDIRFLYYMYLNLDEKKRLKFLYRGLRNTIPKESFLSFKTPFPPIKEQQSIGTFLDEKTSKINQTIAIKEKEIELLKERRQILIQKFVTGKKVWDGKTWVRPSKTKDSGISWIGEIPEHWEIKKLRFEFTLSKGLTITKENLTDNGVLVINYGEIHSKYGFEVNPEIHPLRYVSEDYLLLNKNAILKNGDFVFADTSEDLEGSGNFTYLNSHEQVFAGYHTVIARPKSKVNSRFFAYEFHCSNFKNQVRAKMKGVKVYSITQSILKDMFLWIPSKVEQDKIVEYLDERCKILDELILLKKQEIEKLKEYKTVLIDNVVTGKMRVS